MLEQPSASSSRRGGALVTGASRGLGRAISIALARAGYDVALAARTLQSEKGHTDNRDPMADPLLPGSLEETAALVRACGRHAYCIHMDLTDESCAIEAALKADDQLGGINVLVNNAIYKGAGSEQLVLELSGTNFGTMMQANVNTQVAIVRVLLPRMLARGHGAIVQMVSSSTDMRPTRPVGKGGWDFGYAATKAAISKLVPILSVEYPFVKSGIRFFNVEPGLVVTEMMKTKGTAEVYRQFGDVPPEVSGAAIAHLVTAEFGEVSKYSGAPFVFAPRLVSDLNLLPGYIYKEAKVREVAERTERQQQKIVTRVSTNDGTYPYPPEELHRAYAHYCKVKDHCSKTRDWSDFADLFTEDCYYCEHAYGEFHGRRAVREDYITKVMKPYPDMTFPHDWHVFDYERGAVVVMVQNALPPPHNPETNEAFKIPNISRLVYGGNGLWKEQQDWYNPLFHAKKAVSDWRQAGGKFQSEEALKMKHSTPSASNSKL